MPFSSNGTLTISHTFRELVLCNTVDADFVRRDTGVRGRLARALNRTAEAIARGYVGGLAVDVHGPGPGERE